MRIRVLSEFRESRPSSICRQDSAGGRSASFVGNLHHSFHESTARAIGDVMNLLLMLEDDHDRIARFRAIVVRHHPNAVLTIARTAPEFESAYWSLTETPDLIAWTMTCLQTHPTTLILAMDAMCPVF